MLAKFIKKQLLGWQGLALACTAAVYAPFLGGRFIRTTGDEKGYIAQAFEMARGGRWFLQTIHDEPRYFKGPLHYILMRLGFMVFGMHSPWAVLYMNFTLVILAGILLGRMVQKLLPGFQDGPAWLSLFFPLCVGVYAYSFASQMDVELAAFYVVAMFLLERLGKHDVGFGFWLVAGLMGWLKAPAHSVFIGLSAVLFWGMTGELWQRLKNLRSWLAVIAGVALCVAGYAPAFFMDRANLLGFFSESMTLAGSGQGWWVCIQSTFGFFLFPWTLFAWVSYVQLVFNFKSLIRDPGRRRLVYLALSCCIPTVTYFLFDSYRYEHYDLPVIGAVMLLIAAAYSAHSRKWEVAYRVALGLTCLLILVFPVMISVMVAHFGPMPSWWHPWILPIVWFCALFTIGGVLAFGVLPKKQSLKLVAVSTVGMFLAIGFFFTMLGERELLDLNAYLRTERVGDSQPLYYSDLQKRSTPEWGVLNLWIRQPVYGVFTLGKLTEALKSGAPVLVPNFEPDEVTALLNSPLAGFTATKSPWKHWRTHGMAEDGDSLWVSAWKKHDLSVLERDYWIVRWTPADKLVR